MREKKQNDWDETNREENKSSKFISWPLRIKWRQWQFTYGIPNNLLKIKEFKKYTIDLAIDYNFHNNVLETGENHRWILGGLSLELKIAPFIENQVSLHQQFKGNYYRIWIYLFNERRKQLHLFDIMFWFFKNDFLLL